MAKPIRVLLIDEDAEARAGLLDLILEANLKAEVFEASSGQEGIKAFLADSFDCVFLEYRLHDMNGLDLLLALASQETLKETPIIMLTSHGDELVATEAMKRGAYDYLPRNGLTAETLRRSLATVLVHAARQQRLEQQQQAFEEFAAVAAHDLKAPLRQVASFAQLLERRLRGSGDVKVEEYVDRIVTSSRHMGELIDALLDYTRADAPYEVVDLGAVAQKVLNLLDRNIEEAGAQVEVGPLPSVYGDKSALTQLFQNLIANAVKFRGDKPPRVKVAAREEGPSWLFSVEDNGIGIPSESYNEVFVALKRLHGRGDYEGTGLGLATCRKIVQRHGGRIWVESEPGKGSRFFFVLPAARPEDESSQEAR